MSQESSTRLIEYWKISLGIIFVVFLWAALIVTLFVPRNIELRRSNEEIAYLKRQTLIDLDQKRRNLFQQMETEKQNQTERFHLESLKVAQENLEQRKLARDQEIIAKNEQIFDRFLDHLMNERASTNVAWIRWKVHSLFRRLDGHFKSLTIQVLYEGNHLNAIRYPNRLVDLSNFDLKDLVLNKVKTSTQTQQDLRKHFEEIHLSRAILINGSFEGIIVNRANFSQCQLDGISFRWSQVGEVDFRSSSMSLSDFRDARVVQSDFSNSLGNRSSFVEADLAGSKFHNSDFSNSRFRTSNLFQAEFFRALLYSTDFSQSIAINSNFEQTMLVSAIFQSTNLQGASFRSAFLMGANFNDANLFDVDFTGAFLKEASISQQQLDSALSISRAILPDSTMGRNKNFISSDQNSCTQTNGSVKDWFSTGSFLVHQRTAMSKCSFQALTTNATLQRVFNLRRYQKLIQQYQTRIFFQATIFLNSNVTMTDPIILIDIDLQFFNASDIQTHEEKFSFDSNSFIQPTAFMNMVTCPNDTASLNLRMIFYSVNATIENLYVTID